MAPLVCMHVDVILVAVSCTLARMLIPHPALHASGCRAGRYHVATPSVTNGLTTDMYGRTPTCLPCERGNWYSGRAKKH
jgi:hypothetical protein